MFLADFLCIAYPQYSIFYFQGTIFWCVYTWKKLTNTDDLSYYATKSELSSYATTSSVNTLISNLSSNVNNLKSAILPSGYLSDKLQTVTSSTSFFTATEDGYYFIKASNGNTASDLAAYFFTPDASNEMISSTLYINAPAWAAIASNMIPLKKSTTVRVQAQCSGSAGIYRFY